MRRREIIALLGGAAAGWPLPALAQAGGTRRVGVLLAFDESDPRPQAWLATFTQSLAKLGWTAGRNVQIEIRWAGNDVELMRKFAKELVASKPNVILAFGTVTAALQREARTIPIVFAIVSDPPIEDSDFVVKAGDVAARMSEACNKAVADRSGSNFSRKSCPDLNVSP